MKVLMPDEVKQKNIITKHELRAILFAVESALLGVKSGARLNATLKRSLESVGPKIQRTLYGMKG